MINKLWNKKPKGIVAAFALSLQILAQKFSVKFYSIIHKNNLASCGKQVLIYPGFEYRYPSSIMIGNNVTIAKNVTLSRGEIKEGRIFINDGVSIDNGCFIDYSGSVIIDENAHIAWGVYITTHSHGYDYRNKPIGKNLHIGENAFLGAKSIILYNCNYIGKNAVIGMGSVVTKDVPDNAIVGGNPAKIIKYRDDIE